MILPLAIAAVVSTLYPRFIGEIPAWIPAGEIAAEDIPQRLEGRRSRLSPESFTIMASLWDGTMERGAFAGRYLLLDGRTRLSAWNADRSIWDSGLYGSDGSALPTPVDSTRIVNWEGLFAMADDFLARADGGRAGFVSEGFSSSVILAGSAPIGWPVSWTGYRDFLTQNEKNYLLSFGDLGSDDWIWTGEQTGYSHSGVIGFLEALPDFALSGSPFPDLAENLATNPPDGSCLMDLADIAAVGGSARSLCASNLWRWCGRGTNEDATAAFELAATNLADAVEAWTNAEWNFRNLFNMDFATNAYVFAWRAVSNGCVRVWTTDGCVWDIDGSDTNHQVTAWNAASASEDWMRYRGPSGLVTVASTDYERARARLGHSGASRTRRLDRAFLALYADFLAAADGDYEPVNLSWNRIYSNGLFHASADLGEVPATGASVTCTESYGTYTLHVTGYRPQPSGWGDVSVDWTGADVIDSARASRGPASFTARASVPEGSATALTLERDRLEAGLAEWGGWYGKAKLGDVTHLAGSLTEWNGSLWMAIDGYGSTVPIGVADPAAGFATSVTVRVSGTISADGESPVAVVGSGITDWSRWAADMVESQRFWAVDAMIWTNRHETGDFRWRGKSALELRLDPALGRDGAECLSTNEVKTRLTGAWERLRADTLDRWAELSGLAAPAGISEAELDAASSAIENADPVELTGTVTSSLIAPEVTLDLDVRWDDDSDRLTLTDGRIVLEYTDHTVTNPLGTAVGEWSATFDEAVLVSGSTTNDFSGFTAYSGAGLQSFRKYRFANMIKED